MPFGNDNVKKIGWKAKIRRGGGENGTCTNVTSRRRRVGLPSDDISGHQKRRKN